ncbi:MAG: hypothetical protein QOI71_1300 [Gaiellales bacterium]|nr:hypothetical protein [Gaiellales bacterium]
MATWLWVIVIIAALAVVALVVAMANRHRRTDELRRGFGPEYERTVERTGDAGQAEADLRERRRRHDALELHRLDPRSRKRFIDDWQTTQAEFVDDPEHAIQDADRLIQNVMRDRGYPVEDFDDRAAIISVDHPVVVERYRRAHTIVVGAAGGDSDTESLRLAMQDYRALFDELVEDDAPQNIRA